MSSISTFLDNISSANYGDDVRDSIIGALQQCYADATGNPNSVSGIIENYRVSKESIDSAVNSLTDLSNTFYKAYNDSGQTIQSTETASSVSLANNTWVNCGSITLTPGLWIVIYGSEFTANATGERMMDVNLSSTAPTGTSRWTARIAGNATVSNIFRVLIMYYSNNTTLYLWGKQNSGSALTAYPILRATKIKGVNNLPDAGKSLLTGMSWESGSINDDGSFISTNTRIRTADYIDISKGRTITFKVSSGYKYDYEVYTFDKVRTIKQGSGAWTTNNQTVTFDDDVYYLKFILATTSDATVDTSIVTNFQANYQDLPQGTILDQVITNTSDIVDIKTRLTTDESNITTLSEQVTTNTTDITELKARADEIDTFTNDLSLGVDFETGLARLYVDDEPVGDAVRIADEEGMQTLVNNWLDSHPEVTTTVQDGSITEAKLASEVSSKFTDLHDEILSKNAERIQEIAVERSRIDALSTLENQFDSLISQGVWTPHLYDYNTKIRDIGVDSGKYLRIGPLIIYHYSSNACSFANVSTMVQIRNFPTFEYNHVRILGGTFYSAGISANSGGNETVQRADDAFYLRPNLTSSSWATASSPGWTSFMIIGHLFT